MKRSETKITVVLGVLALSGCSLHNWDEIKDLAAAGATSDGGTAGSGALGGKPSRGGSSGKSGGSSNSASTSSTQAQGGAGGIASTKGSSLADTTANGGASSNSSAGSVGGAVVGGSSSSTSVPKGGTASSTTALAGGSAGLGGVVDATTVAKGGTTGSSTAPANGGAAVGGASSPSIGGSSASCTLGSRKCVGNVPHACTNGAWASETTCGGSTPYCNGAGVCGVCSSGSKQCSGKVQQLCSATGAWQDNATCGVASVCKAGECIECPGSGGPAMVGLPLGYCIDSTEVTRGQYASWTASAPPTTGQIAACTWNTTYTSGILDWPAAYETLKKPITGVDWCDAQAFCKGVGKRLCGKIGGGANAVGDFANAGASQWFAACSSNSGLKYPYGNTYSATTCNGYESANEKPVDVGTMSGCQSSRTGYAGVFDLSGNVYEWEDACDGSAQLDYCRIRGGAYNYYGLGSFNTGLDCGHDSAPQQRVMAIEWIGFRCCAF